MGATPDKPSRPSKPKGPSLTSIRRNKTLSTDGHTVKFLYLMLKQFNLRSVDWETVADRTDMSEGRAARMRFNRFKIQMDKILRSEELLEAKLEENSEDAVLEKEDTTTRVLGYLEDLEYDRENATQDVKFEQEPFGRGEGFAIKPEPDACTTIGRFKFEVNNHVPHRPAIERNLLPMVIKIEDDDSVEAVGDRCGAQQAIQENSRFLYHASRYGTHTRPITQFHGSGIASATSASCLPLQNSRRTSNTLWPQQQSNTKNLDNTPTNSEIEFIGTNRRPSDPPY